MQTTTRPEKAMIETTIAYAVAFAVIIVGVYFTLELLSLIVKEREADKK